MKELVKSKVLVNSDLLTQKVWELTYRDKIYTCSGLFWEYTSDQTVVYDPKMSVDTICIKEDFGGLGKQAVKMYRIPFSVFLDRFCENVTNQ